MNRTIVFPLQPAPPVRSNLPAALLLILALLPLSCSYGTDTPDGASRAFLEALQEGDFQTAADLSLDSSAGLILFMEKMIKAANERPETGQESLSLPIPPKDTDITLISAEERTGYQRMSYRIGEKVFVLHAIESDGEWFIELPRESWDSGDGADRR